MNKTENINLGGIPLTMDEDAYFLLNDYLCDLEDHFSSTPGCEGIMEDIEVRLSELIIKSMGNQKITTTKDIDYAIKIMGSPGDFDNAHSPRDEDIHQTKIKTGKRLFRNPDDKVIGGVCSGIAAYFGIEDPLWVRIGFLILIFFGGVSGLLYFLLWAIIPEAKTRADKLKMRGEPTTVKNIAKVVEKELEDFSKKVSNIGKKNW